VGDATYLLDLVAPEHGQTVDDDPGQRAAIVEDLVDDEGHDARGEDIVAHPRVPGQPHLLEVAERDVVLGDLLEGAPVRVLRHWRQNGGRVPEAHVRRMIRNWAPGRRATYILAGCSKRGGESGRGWRVSGRGEGREKRRRGGGLNCGLEVAGGSTPAP
jgi:hypothetical protein